MEYAHTASEASSSRVDENDPTSPVRHEANFPNQG